MPGYNEGLQDSSLRPQGLPEYARQRIVSFRVSERLVLSAALAFVIACAWSTGCDMPPRPPLKPDDIRPSNIAESIGSRLPVSTQRTPDVVEASGGWETWDAYFIGNRQVGYSHLVAESVNDRSDVDVRFDFEDRLYIRRGKSRFLQRLQQTSTQTKSGQLLGFESVMQVGPSITRYQGSVDEDLLRIETTRGGSQSESSITWKPTYRGLVALEQSLRQRPMTEAGETREFELLLPGRYELAEARLYCSGEAVVPLLDGTSSALMEINVEFLVEGQPIYSTVWTDPQGAIVRTYSPGLNLVSYRTDEATATDLGAQPDVAAIEVSGSIDSDKWARRVGFKIKSGATSDSASGFQPGPGQYLRRSQDGSIQILVSRDSKSAPKGFASDDPEPLLADSQPNPLIDFQSQSVRRFANAAIGPRKLTDRENALELALATSDMIDQDGQADGFTNASDVFRRVAGNDTDRAVLLAALLRSREIPSRLAVGLKYEPSEPPQMRYHVWTLAHVDGQWLHLDPDKGGEAAADRLLFTTTNLSEGVDSEGLIELIDLLGRIEIEIAGAQY